MCSQINSSVTTRVGNQAILMHKGNEREDVSLSRIPLTHMSMAETSVAENNKFQTDLLKENLQRISEDEATALVSKIQNDRRYIKNVVEAAHAIGITRVENNAARLFFVHAKNLATKSGYLPSTAQKVTKSNKPNLATLLMFDRAAVQMNNVRNTTPPVQPVNVPSKQGIMAAEGCVDPSASAGSFCVVIAVCTKGV